MSPRKSVLPSEGVNPIPLEGVRQGKIWGVEAWVWAQTAQRFNNPNEGHTNSRGQTTILPQVTMLTFLGVECYFGFSLFKLDKLTTSMK